MAHVWLIGMMGTGKTTVGALVAERLGLPLEDTDAVIMERTGKTIPELFAISEAEFRRQERAVVVDIAQGPRSVVSAGGGSVLDAESADLMGRTGIRVLLEASMEELAGRLTRDGSRPLISSPGDVAALVQERRKRYRAASDHIVDTSGRTPEDVAEEVILCVTT